MTRCCRIVCLLSVIPLSAGIGRAGEARLEQRVYAVSDLVVSVENTAKFDNKPASATRATGWAVSREQGPKMAHTVGSSRNTLAVTCEDRLIKLITDTIAPRSWAEQGGRGTIDYHPLTMALVINQTPDVQDQVADILAALRRQHDMQVSLEVKFVSITDEVFQELQQKGMLGEQDKKKHAHGNVAFLDDATMLRFMEAIQSDIHSNVMQAPKLTMFNGQNVEFDAGDYQTFVTGLEIVHRDDHIEYRPKTETVPLGVRMGLRSIISSDRRSVRVDLDVTLSNLASEGVPKFPITTPDPEKGIGPDGKPATVTHYLEQPKVVKVGVKRTLAIPDGHTAVLTGSTSKTVAASVSKVPILGDVPLVGRLFCSYECHPVTEHLLVMVTPRIHVEEEKEEKQTKSAAVKKTICPCDDKEDGRMSIQPPVREGETIQSEEPSEACILRALPRTVRVPGIFEESRDNIQVVVERIVDKIDPPRFFPLVGPARLHHCHWKCSVYYTETIAGAYPFSFRYKRPRIEVVYIDSDHLHLVDAANTK